MTRKSHKQWAEEEHPPEAVEDVVYKVLFGDEYERVALKDFPSKGLLKEVECRHGQHWVKTKDGQELYAVKCRPPWEVEAAVKESPKIYPSIYGLGLSVTHEDSGPPYVKREELLGMLERKGKKFADKYHDLFGIQTCRLEGPYPWDVEAVLHRMLHGIRIGSQLIWD